MKNQISEIFGKGYDWKYRWFRIKECFGFTKQSNPTIVKTPLLLEYPKQEKTMTAEQYVVFQCKVKEFNNSRLTFRKTILKDFAAKLADSGISREKIEFADKKLAWCLAKVSSDLPIPEFHLQQKCEGIEAEIIKIKKSYFELAEITRQADAFSNVP